MWRGSPVGRHPRPPRSIGNQARLKPEKTINRINPPPHPVRQPLSSYFSPSRVICRCMYVSYTSTVCPDQRLHLLSSATSSCSGSPADQLLPSQPSPPSPPLPIGPGSGPRNDPLIRKAQDHVASVAMSNKQTVRKLKVKMENLRN